MKEMVNESTQLKMLKKSPPTMLEQQQHQEPDSDLDIPSNIDYIDISDDEELWNKSPDCCEYIFLHKLLLNSFVMH